MRLWDWPDLAHMLGRRLGRSPSSKERAELLLPEVEDPGTGKKDKKPKYLETSTQMLPWNGTGGAATLQ